MINLSEFHSYVADNQPNICQVAVIQNGKTMINDIWNGYKADDTVHTMSATKSIVSLLAGIAIEQGLIGSVDDYVLDYFPDYRIKRGEKTIQKVKLKHILTMTAPYKYKSEPWSKICVQEDWSIAALDFLGGRRGMTGKFQYSTLGIHILTGIITAVSKMTTVDFANKYLFEPLTIAPRKIYVAPDAEAHKAFTVGKTPKGNIWFSDDKGVGAAGYGLCLSAEEMSKIGLLCLNKGVFNNRRIVSGKWIAESTTVRLHCGEKFRDMKYGYLWWIIDENEGSYAAIGNSGNVIYINPQKELVVAVSGYFKPTVFDRIDFIKGQIEGRIEN
ncbi:MAG: serine hydrolase [Lachnospiraceae bacterium]|nr:serine hydrolase [Lachnospiraceae bacterium]